MTTLTCQFNHPHNGLKIALTGIIILVALAIPAYKASEHMLNSHPDESAIIRQCAGNPDNLVQVWLNSSGQRINCLIKLPDGRLGNLVVQWSCRKLQWAGIAAYIIGDGKLKSAIDVMKAKACTQVW